MMVLDGGFGTMLQAVGLPPGKDPTDFNIENPDAVERIHRAYADAGADIVLSNPSGANRLKYHGNPALPELIARAIRIAKRSGARVALDVGPTGRLLKPAGDVEFDVAVSAFGEQVKAGADAGADLVFIETMGDLYELKAAVIAAKENCLLPIYATVALGEDGKLLTGGSVECVAALLNSLGASACGLNCGLGPDQMLPYVRRLRAATSLPIIVKPNAGMPKLINGKTVFSVGPVEFAKHVSELVEAGASIVGGCCGTTPDHIREIVR